MLKCGDALGYWEFVIRISELRNDAAYGSWRPTPNHFSRCQIAIRVRGVSGCPRLREERTCRNGFATTGFDPNGAVRAENPHPLAKIIRYLATVFSHDQDSKWTSVCAKRLKSSPKEFRV